MKNLKKNDENWTAKTVQKHYAFEQVRGVGDRIVCTSPGGPSGWIECQGPKGCT